MLCGGQGELGEPSSVLLHNSPSLDMLRCRPHWFNFANEKGAMRYLAFPSRIEDHGQELRRRVAEAKPGLIECAKTTDGRKALCCTASARLPTMNFGPEAPGRMRKRGTWRKLWLSPRARYVKAASSLAEEEVKETSVCIPELPWPPDGHLPKKWLLDEDDGGKHR